MTVTKRHLRDLYVKGKETTLTDGRTVEEETTNDDGETVVERVELPAVQVYLRKINLTDSQTAFRKANAARARVLSSFADKESEAYQSVLADVLETPTEGLIDLTIGSEAVNLLDSAMSETADNEEWSKDDYLQGLYDAWEELKDGDPDDPERDRVRGELDRYEAEVQKIVDAGLESLRRDKAEMNPESLREEAVKMMLKVQADAAWLDTFRKSEIYFATRHNDKRDERYFDSPGEVDELEPEVFGQLVREYQSITVDTQEGKD